MNSLSICHPAVSALYFISVLVITMFFAHPALLLIALLGAVLFYFSCEKQIRFCKELGFYLALFLLISLTNPLFSHNGVTPLFFLNGNPVTLEALLNGMNIGVMLLAVIYWFKCFNCVMTQDKLLFLFAKLSSQIALLLSSALRLIPLLKAQAAKIRQTQKAMGLFASDTWMDKLKGLMRVYSSLISWALENAIDTGSSMKGRGYGLRDRSHYSTFSFRKSDAWLLAVIAVLDGMVVGVMAVGQLTFSFYPAITFAPVTIYNLTAIAAFAVLSLLPFILEGKEILLWSHYRSKI